MKTAVVYPSPVAFDKGYALLIISHRVQVILIYISFNKRVVVKAVDVNIIMIAIHCESKHISIKG